jgi:hypothetical protein
LLALLSSVSAVSAQEPTPPPPTGPAQIIGGAARARASRELKEATQRGTEPAQQADPSATPSPSQTPTSSPTTAPTPTPDSGLAAPNPHGAAAHPDMQREDALPPIATEAVEPSLAAGTVLVRVLDPSGKPAANAEVLLGVMESDGNRSTKNAKTNADGTLQFRDLAVGDKQAYRVNVPYRGAKYSSNPFRLPPRGGYRVEIRQLPVTTDNRLVVLYMGATSIELKDDRLKVVQQARLLNLGRATYVFPGEGTLVPLPKGFMAVQSEEVMTDQRVTESKGEGVRVRGSLAPGEVTLLWGFDLPLEGEQVTFTIGIPWVAFAYRVISDAPKGMTLSVAGLPEPIVHDDAGRRLLVTEIQLKVGDPRLSELRIELRGIPGPGSARWVAAGLAVALLLGGVVFAVRPAAQTERGASRLRAEEIEARKRELLERARELQSQRARDEIGPQYHAEQLELVRDELAALLLSASASTGTGTGRPA